MDACSLLPSLPLPLMYPRPRPLLRAQAQRKLFELKCEFNCTEDLNSALVKTEGFVDSESRLITKDQFQVWASRQLNINFERNELDADAEDSAERRAEINRQLAQLGLGENEVAIERELLARTKERFELEQQQRVGNHFAGAHCGTDRWDLGGR